MASFTQNTSFTNNAEFTTVKRKQKKSQPCHKSMGAGFVNTPDNLVELMLSSSTIGDGLCYLNLIEKSFRLRAVTALGLWPTKREVREYCTNNGNKYSTDRVAAVSVLRGDTTQASCAVHIIAGNMFPAEVMKTLSETTRIGGLSYEPRDRPLSCVLVVLSLCVLVFAAYSAHLVSQRQRVTANKRKLISLGPKGFNMKKMPTRAEQSGAKAAGVYRDGAQVPISAQQEVATSSLWDAIVNWAPNKDLAEADAFGAVVLEPVAVRLVSLTAKLAGALGRFNYHNVIASQTPTLDIQFANVCWGYNIPNMPSTGMGPGYSDKHQFISWAKPTSVNWYSVKDTGVGYTTPKVKEARKIGGEADRTDETVDTKEFSFGFDRPKKTSIEFLKAGKVKAQRGDNHIGVLIQMILTHYAVLQAAEQDVSCSTQFTQDIIDAYTVPITLTPGGKDTVESHIADSLAAAWRNVNGRGTYEMMLPGDSADATDIGYLMFLCGMTQGNTVWTYQKRPLNMIPYFATHQTLIATRLRIPQCNSTESVAIGGLVGKPFIVEPGKCESIIVDYVRRMGLQDQLHNAQLIAASIAVGSSPDSKKATMIGIPAPNHVQEYDLWRSERGLGVKPSFSLVQGESMCQLAALLQIQRNVLLDVITAKMLEHLYIQGRAMTSRGGGMAVQQYFKEVLKNGPQQLLVSWTTAMFGYHSVEQEKLVYPNMNYILSDVTTHLETGKFRPTSLMMAGTSLSHTSLALIWDDQARRNCASGVYATPQDAAVLTSLYSKTARIFETEGPYMRSFIGDVTLEKSQRLTNHSVGTRNLRNVVGQPRIFYFGPKVNTDMLVDRIAHAGSGRRLAKHYEPTYDLASATIYVDSKTRLEAQLGDEPTLHGKDSATAGSYPFDGRQVTRRPSLPELNRGSIIAAPGKALNAIDQHGVVKPPPGSGLGNGPSGLVFRQEVESDWYQIQRTHQYVNQAQDWNMNGTRSQYDRMKTDAEARLEQAAATKLEPEVNKASEEMDVNPKEALNNTISNWNTTVTDEFEVNVPTKLQQDVGYLVNEEEILGDGRCGARAIQVQLARMGTQVALKELFALEAQLAGSKLSRLPSHIWAPDEMLYMLADHYGYNLALFVENGLTPRKVTSVRVVNNKTKRPTIEILSQPRHWSACYFKCKFDYTNSERLSASLRTACEAQAAEAKKGIEGVQPTKLKGAGNRKSGKARQKVAQGDAPFLTDNGSWTVKPKSATGQCSGPANTSIGALPRDEYERKFTHTWALNDGAFGSKVMAEHTNTYGGMRATPALLSYVKDRVLSNLGVSAVLTSASNHSSSEVEAAISDAYNMTPDAVADMDWYYASPTSLKVLVGATHVSTHLLHVSQETEGGMWKVVKTTTWCTTNDHSNTPFKVFVERRGLIAEINTDETDGGMRVVGVHGLDRWLRDVKFAPFSANTNGSAFCLDESGDAQQWKEKVNSELQRIRQSTITTRLQCNPAEMHTLFPTNRGSDEAPRDQLKSNLEKLAGACALMGYRRDAMWMLSSAAEWLESMTGVRLEADNWIDVKTMSLLLNTRGIKLWMASPGTQTLTEYSTERNKHTIPVILTMVSGSVYPTTVNGNAAKLTSPQDFSTYCDALRREHGELPLPPQEGPSLPNLKVVTTWTTGSIVAWSMLGVASLGVVSYGLVTLYRRQAKLSTIGAFVNRSVRGVGDNNNAEEQRLLQNTGETIWDDKWSISSANADSATPMPEDVSVYTMRTVDMVTEENAVGADGRHTANWVTKIMSSL